MEPINDIISFIWVTSGGLLQQQQQQKKNKKKIQTIGKQYLITIQSRPGLNFSNLRLL